ncbi:alpha/beta hydrolase family protein [Halanaerobium saccharolyticum]|uniref:Alpha/beta hydrolase family protein n=1 Tax=Halanaerobium saccharolyticum TaxID=43595 RepID=A0A4R6M0S0_9FIRM|nr:alpha/beta hydrolase family protein [Halanaerobium saccharolyticum]
MIEGITIVDGPMWTIHPVYCENTIIRNLKIITDGPNTDGINPDSCKNMLIEDCDFETGDDCIAIKSGINEDGRRVNKPTENLLIRNCKAKEGHGGVVIGSEMSGGVKNVHVHDCVFNGGERGVRLKSMRGRGGCVENLLFENIEINNLRDQGIILNMYYDATTVEPRSEMPPLFRNITVRNIKGKNIKQPVVLRGLPEKKMKDITLENIELSGEDGLSASDLDGLHLKNIKLKLKAEAQFKFKNIDNLNIENSSCQENKPELQFQAESREEWCLWRQKLKAQIAELIGGIPQSSRVTELKILEKSEFKTYSRIRIAYQVEGYLKIPAYMLIPDQNAEKYPAIVLAHGHGNGNRETLGLNGTEEKLKEATCHNNLALDFVEAGYIVLVPELIGFGERRLKEDYQKDPDLKENPTANSCYRISSSFCYMVRVFSDSDSGILFLLLKFWQQEVM